MFNKILILILIVALTVACVLQGNYLHHASEVLLTALEPVTKAYEEKNFELAVQHFQHFMEEWDIHEQLFASLLEHAEIDLLYAEIESVHAWLLAGDTNNTPASLAKLAYYLKHIPLQDDLSLENIL